jgi:hypothetical protein
MVMEKETFKIGRNTLIVDNVNRTKTWNGKNLLEPLKEYEHGNDTYKQVPVEGRKEFFEDENNKTLYYYRVYKTGDGKIDIIPIYKYQKFEDGNYFFNTSPDSKYGTNTVSENDNHLYFEVPREREQWESMEGGKQRRNSKKRNTKRRNSKKRRSYKKR